jgi:site-specific DNA recombinase
MLKYIVYCRKSSEDEDHQALSIDAQLEELNQFAREKELTIIARLDESKSAKEPGREVFNEMLQRIERGEADAILCWALNRIARNFDDGGKVIGMLQRGAIQEIRTLERVYLPSDNVLMMALEFGQANQYVRDLSRDIRRGIREKVRRGIYSGLAPLGYFNEPKLRTIEPNPQTFPKVKRALELFATGEYSLTAIQREMAAAGIVGKLSGKPLPLSSIGNAFRNPFYYGVFSHKGELHQGVHVPMISKETYDDVQRALVAVGKPRKRKGDKGFAFLDFATCGSCGYCITAERHIKKSGLRFHYYRCTHKNKKAHCEDRHFVREDKLAAEVKRNIALVTLPAAWKERYLARIETWEDEASQARQRKIEECRSKLVALKGKLDRLNTAFADGGLDLQEFKEMKNPLVPQKVELEQQLVALQKITDNRLEPLKNWVFEANQAEKWGSANNWSEMKSFLKKVGSNRILRAETLTVSFTKPWNSLVETVVAVRDTSDVSLQSSKWWRRRELNPRPRQNYQPRLHA